MKRFILFSLFTFFSSSCWCSDICAYVSQNNFDQVDKLVQLKVREFRNLKSLPSNREKLDSLENWLKEQACVNRAYWDKNTAFILITTTFVHQIGVEFLVGDSIKEKCYSIRVQKQKYGDWLFWRWGWDITDNRIKYLNSTDCKGFVQTWVDIDSSNARSMRNQKNNYSVRLYMELMNEKPAYGSYFRPVEEGDLIKVKFTVHNTSEVEKRIVWPQLQNHGKKAVYFELLDKRGKSIRSEDRNIWMEHDETIPFDVLKLRAGEKRSFYHTINGRLPHQRPIEYNHSLGIIQEGDYKLKAYYDPAIFDFSEDENLWMLKGIDKIQMGSSIPFRVMRSKQYQAILNQVRYRKDISNMDLAEVVCKLKVIDGGGSYLYKNGQNTYDAIGVVDSCLKGSLSRGDTIAFSFRYGQDGKMGLQDQIRQEIIKSEIKLDSENNYWIYATLSEGSYYQIQNGIDHPLLKGKRNYQLINYPAAIQKEENHYPDVQEK